VASNPPKTPRRPSLLARLNRESTEVSHLVEVLRDNLRELYRSQLPRMAAAMAYRTIFAIVPVFVIALVVFGAVVSDDEIEWGVSQLLDFTQLSDIALEEAPAVPEKPLEYKPGDVPPQPVQLESGDIALDPEAAVTTDEGPTMPELEGARLDAWITNLIQQIRKVPKTAIGLVSGLFLIYAAIGMLVETERCFNHIYRVVVGRRWWTRITLYWTMLTLGTILLGATFFVGQRFHAWVISAKGETALGWLRVNVLGFLATVAISTLLLTIAYSRVPNTRVKLRPALVGAVVAAILWEAGKWGFTQYVSYSSNYARFYGSLALIPLFMLWVYVTWLVVLFGLQVAYALQTYASRQREAERDDNQSLIVEPEMVLAVAASIARAFDRGKRVHIEAVAEDTGLPESVCGQMVMRLEKVGLVNRLESDEDEPEYAPGRPAERIGATELLDAVDDLACYERPPAVAEARQARRHALEGRTLADTMADAPAAG
jgi:membrane protein